MNTIGEVLMKLGVDPANRGYDYLKDAVKIVLENHKSVYKVISDVYERIANKYDVTTASVERCMRTSIADCFTARSSELVTEYFSGVTKCRTGSVAVSTFIAVVAERIRVNQTDIQEVLEEARSTVRVLSNLIVQLETATSMEV